jgi:uncharacterized protein YxjI
LIRQRKEMLEVFTSLETKNRYEISTPDGRTTLFAAEQGSGAGAWLSRNFFNTARPFHIAIRDGQGRPILDVHRPWRWLFARIDVVSPDGKPIGAIQQRFAFFSRRFSVLDASGTEIAALHGPLLRPWTFRILVQDREVGLITKKFSGLLREAFTDADTFGVEFGPGMDPRLRTLSLAATFLIDFLYFEHKSQG